MAMILCGFFCAGKSTVGQILAEKLSISFYDTDRMMEAAYGKSVSTMWRELGSEGFRALESSHVFSLKKRTSIIATGGGTLLREKNRNYLKELGPSIYLKASLHVLYERVSKKGLPAYLDISRPFEHFEALAKERFPIYENHCQYMIETENLTANDVVEKIWEAIVSGKFSASPHGESHMERL